MGIGLRELLLVVLVFLVVLPIYFAPALVARSKKHANTTAIFVLNLFGGWMFVPWLIALVWAFKVPDR